MCAANRHGYSTGHRCFLGRLSSTKAELCGDATRAPTVRPGFGGDGEAISAGSINPGGKAENLRGLGAEPPI